MLLFLQYVVDMCANTMALLDGSSGLTLLTCYMFKSYCQWVDNEMQVGVNNGPAYH